MDCEACDKGDNTPGNSRGKHTNRLSRTSDPKLVGPNFGQAVGPPPCSFRFLQDSFLGFRGPAGPCTLPLFEVEVVAGGAEFRAGNALSSDVKWACEGARRRAAHATRREPGEGFSGGDTGPSEVS